jgi:hypothetical protein
MPAYQQQHIAGSGTLARQATKHVQRSIVFLSQSPYLLFWQTI